MPDFALLVSQNMFHAFPCRAWVALVGLEKAQEKLSVCIGSTSAKACWNVGLDKVLYPDAPGIEKWAEYVVKGLQDMNKLPAVVA